MFLVYYEFHQISKPLIGSKRQQYEPTWIMLLELTTNVFKIGLGRMFKFKG